MDGVWWIKGSSCSLEALASAGLKRLLFFMRINFGLVVFILFSIPETKQVPAWGTRRPLRQLQPRRQGRLDARHWRSRGDQAAPGQMSSSGGEVGKDEDMGLAVQFSASGRASSGSRGGCASE